ncbi:MAG: hypothetical protein ACLPT6_10395 [Desulfobaccales bacterium]
MQSLWQWFLLLSPTGKLCAGIGLFLAIIGTYYNFAPKISVNISDSLNPINPFATKFVIRNDSLLPIYSVTPSFKNRKITTEAKNYIIGSDRIDREKPVYPIPVLNPGDSTTFILPFPINLMSPVIQADIEIIVSYRPALSPFKHENRFRFVTVPAIDNVLHWQPKSLSEQSTNLREPNK